MARPAATWWVTYADGCRALRILPSIGPADDTGVISGLFEHVVGAWVPVADMGGRP